MCHHWIIYPSRRIWVQEHISIYSEETTVGSMVQVITMTGTDTDGVCLTNVFVASNGKFGAAVAAVQVHAAALLHGLDTRDSICLAHYVLKTWVFLNWMVAATIFV